MKRIPIFELGVSLVVLLIALFLVYRVETTTYKVKEEAPVLVEESFETAIENENVLYVDQNLSIYAKPMVYLHSSKDLLTGNIRTERLLYSDALSSYFKLQPIGDNIINSLSIPCAERVDTLVEPFLHNTPYYIEPYEGKSVPPDAKARSPGEYRLRKIKINRIYAFK